MGTWTEDCDAWEEVGDDEIEWETQNVLKETRQAEREKSFGTTEEEGRTGCCKDS